MTTFAEMPRTFIETEANNEPNLAELGAMPYEATQDLAIEHAVLTPQSALMAAEVELKNIYDNCTNGLQPGQEGFVWPSKSRDIVAITYAQQKVLQALAEINRNTPRDPRTS